VRDRVLRGRRHGVPEHRQLVLQRRERLTEGGIGRLRGDRVLPGGGDDLPGGEEVRVDGGGHLLDRGDDLRAQVVPGDLGEEVAEDLVVLGQVGDRTAVEVAPARR
jgi:hypothetical protein